MSSSVLEGRARDLGAKIGWSLCEIVSGDSGVSAYLHLVNSTAAKTGITRLAELPDPEAVSRHRVWAEMVAFAAFRTLSRSLVETKADIVAAALGGQRPDKELAEIIGGELVAATCQALTVTDHSSFPQNEYRPDVPGRGPSFIEEEFIWSRTSEYAEMAEEEALLLFSERIAHTVAGFGRIHRTAQGCALLHAVGLGLQADQAVVEGARTLDEE